MSTRKKKSGRKQPKKPQRSVVPMYAGLTTKISTAFPDSVLVNLKFIFPNWIQGNSGNYVWSARFRMNNIYDVDPLTGGGTVSGFAEYAAIYAKYRVHKFSYKADFINEMSDATVVSVVPSRDDLGANYVNSYEFGEMPYGKAESVSGKGGMDKIRLSGGIDLAKFCGDSGYYVDDLSAAVVTGGPARTLFFNVAANTYAGQSAASVGVRLVFTYRVHFFERKTILV